MKNNDNLDFVKDWYTSEQELFAWELMCGDKFENFIKTPKPFLTKEQILFGIEKYKKLDLTTQEGKQRLIDGFINAIYVYDDRITFTYNYKDGTETITLSELESAKSSDIKCIGAPRKRGMLFAFLFFLVLLSDENHIRTIGQGRTNR